MWDCRAESSDETNGWMVQKNTFCKGPTLNGFMQYTLSCLDIAAVTKLPNKTLLAVTFTLTNVRSEKFFLVERPTVTFLSAFGG